MRSDEEGEAGVPVERLEVAGRRVRASLRTGGELVVLTRLAASGTGIWGGVWEALAERYAVVSVEHGPPERRLGPAEVLGTYADDIAAVAEGLGAPRHHLVGWNGGAQIALVASQRHAPRLASLTLLTPFRDCADRGQIERGLDFLELFLRSGRRDLYTWHWFMGGLSDRFLQERFDVVARLVERRLESDPFVALDVDRAMAWMRDLRRDHVSDDALRALDLPTLILGAGLNRWHAGPTPGMARRLAALIPGAELAIADGLGALFPLEDPAFAVDRMLPFLAGASSRVTTDY